MDSRLCWGTMCPLSASCRAIRRGRTSCRRDLRYPSIPESLQCCRDPRSNTLTCPRIRVLQRVLRSSSHTQTTCWVSRCRVILRQGRKDVRVVASNDCGAVQLHEAVAGRHRRFELQFCLLPRDRFGQRASAARSGRFPRSPEVDHVRWTTFTLALLRAPRDEVLVASTAMAGHHLTIPVLRVLPATKTLSAAVAPIPLPFPGEEGLHIFLRPHEGLA